MRIIHVANFNTTKYGTDLFATDRKISAGLTRNGHFVYEFSYLDISHSESLVHSKPGISEVNQKLIKACDILSPHLLLLGHSELIEAPTLQKIRKRHPNIKIGLWYVDALFDRQKTGHIFDRLAAIDMVFATTGGEHLKEYATKTSIAAFIPNIIDPAVESKKAFQAAKYDHDFIFCGRDTTDPKRQEFMAHLQTGAAKYLRCTFRGCLGNPIISGYAYLEFLGRSKMALNLSSRNDVTLYSSDRLAQLVGNGLLTFCPRVEGMDRLFSEEELVYYDDLDDLLTKIEFYHRHDHLCRAIAASGWRKAHDSYTCERITRYMLEMLFDVPLSADYEWRNEVYRAS